MTGMPTRTRIGLTPDPAPHARTILPPTTRLLLDRIVQSPLHILPRPVHGFPLLVSQQPPTTQFLPDFPFRQTPIRSLLLVMGFVRRAGEEDVEFATGTSEVVGVAASDAEGFEFVLDVLDGGWIGEVGGRVGGIRVRVGWVGCGLGFAAVWVVGWSGRSFGDDVTFAVIVIVSQEDSFPFVFLHGHEERIPPAISFVQFVLFRRGFAIDARTLLFVIVGTSFEDRSLRDGHRTGKEVVQFFPFFWGHVHFETPASFSSIANGAVAPLPSSASVSGPAADAVAPGPSALSYSITTAAATATGTPTVPGTGMKMFPEMFPFPFLLEFSPPKIDDHLNVSFFELVLFAVLEVVDGPSVGMGLVAIVMMVMVMVMFVLARRRRRFGCGSRFIRTEMMVMFLYHPLRETQGPSSIGGNGVSSQSSGIFPDGDGAESHELFGFSIVSAMGDGFGITFRVCCVVR